MSKSTRIAAFSLLAASSFYGWRALQRSTLLRWLRTSPKTKGYSKEQHARWVVETLPVFGFTTASQAWKAITKSDVAYTDKYYIPGVTEAAETRQAADGAARKGANVVEEKVEQVQQTAASAVSQAKSWLPWSDPTGEEPTPNWLSGHNNWPY